MPSPSNRPPSYIYRSLSALRRFIPHPSSFILALLLALAALPFVTSSASENVGGRASLILESRTAGKPEAYRDVLRLSREGRSLANGSLSWLSNWSAFDSSPTALSSLFSARTLSPLVPVPLTYTWTGALSTDFTVAGNWLPARA